MSDIEELEEYQQQLQAVEEGLKEDPVNQSLLDLKTELVDLISLLEQALGVNGVTGNRAVEEPETISLSSNENLDSVSSRNDSYEKKYADSKGYSQTFQGTTGNHTSQPSPPVPPKASDRPGPGNPPPPLPTSPKPHPPQFTVGNYVMAKYISGDRKFYRAKVTAVTGSKENQIYTVKFQGQSQRGVVETLRSENIRAIPTASELPEKPTHLHSVESFSNSQKQSQKHILTSNRTLAATISVTPAAAAVTTTASSNQQQNPAKRSRLDSDSPVKISKPRTNVSQAKLLDDQKNKWQQFTKKGLKMGSSAKSKKLGGEESMFKSPDDPNGRVGIIGSGHRNTSKDKPRASKHIFDSSTRID